MGRLAFLTDRSPSEALPAVQSLGFDVKVEPLSADSLSHLAGLSPSVVVTDAVADPELAFGLLSGIPAGWRWDEKNQRLYLSARHERETVQVEIVWQ